MENKFDKQSFIKANNKFYIFFLLFIALGLASVICSFTINGGINGTMVNDIVNGIQNGRDPKNYYGKYVFNEENYVEAVVVIDEEKAYTHNVAQQELYPEVDLTALEYKYMSKDYCNAVFEDKYVEYDALALWINADKTKAFIFEIVDSNTLDYSGYIFHKVDENGNQIGGTSSENGASNESGTSSEEVLPSYYGTYSSNNYAPIFNVDIDATQVKYYFKTAPLDYITFSYQYMEHESFEKKYGIDVNYDVLVLYEQSPNTLESYIEIIDEENIVVYYYNYANIECQKTSNSDSLFIEKFFGEYSNVNSSNTIVIYENGAYVTQDGNIIATYTEVVYYEDLSILENVFTEPIISDYPLLILYNLESQQGLIMEVRGNDLYIGSTRYSK